MSPLLPNKVFHATALALRARPAREHRRWPSMIKVLCALLVASSTVLAATDLPKGWRLPTKAELADNERNASPMRYAVAKADFNGDGTEDEALLLKSSTFSGEGLWVRLSGTSKTFTWVKLDEINWGSEYPTVDLAMGIEVAPPGKYPYACFDDDKECDFGNDRPEMALKVPSLVHFKFGSASSMFFWSAKEHKFRRVWTSD